MTSAVMELPVVAPSRRSLRLVQALDDAATIGAQIVLTGSAVHDLLVDPDERALWLPDFLTSVAARRGMGLVLYRLGTQPESLPTAGAGRMTAVPPGNVDDHPSDVIDALLRDVRGADVPTLLVLDYLDLVLPRTPYGQDLLLGALIKRLQEVASDRQWRERRHQVIAVDRGGGLSERLTHQPGYRVVRVDAPDSAETAVYIKRKARAGSRRRLHLAPTLSVQRASRLTGGLLLRTLDEVAALSSPGNPVVPLTLSALKGEAIRQQSGGTLELLEEAVDFGKDVTGLPAVRLHLRQVQSVGGTTVRVLLAGPPGTGKTYSAQAIARLLGVPLVSFGRILGELLGQAEHNMDVALAVVMAMAPCALFIDEADQGPLSPRRASGATSNEAYQALRAKLFNFLSDPGDDVGVSVIATTNVPTPRHMDAAALDRFKVLPVLFPTGQELVEVVAIQARRAGIALAGGVRDALLAYSAKGQVISARTATELVRDARVVARERGGDTIEGSDMARAIEERFRDDWTPETEYSTLTSIAAAKSATALPWVAAERLGEVYEKPAYLKAFFDVGGKLDVRRILARIQELEATDVYRG